MPQKSLKKEISFQILYLPKKCPDIWSVVIQFIICNSIFDTTLFKAFYVSEEKKYKIQTLVKKKNWGFAFGVESSQLD